MSSYQPTEQRRTNGIGRLALPTGDETSRINRQLERYPLAGGTALSGNSACAVGQLLHADAGLSFPHFEERLAPHVAAVIRKEVGDEWMRPPHERYRPRSHTLVKPLQNIAQ
jgi:hypothetical protein